MCTFYRFTDHSRHSAETENVALVPESGRFLKKNQKKVPEVDFQVKKRLFRGESYTEIPKSVPDLAGHLQSEMSYKAVYKFGPGFWGPARNWPGTLKSGPEG